MTDVSPRPVNDLEITPQDVATMRADGRQSAFIDCRKPEEHETARIEGSTLIPLADLDLHLPSLREHEDDLMVVYCHTGRRSLTMTTVLRDKGFSNVKSMAGGIERWSLEIDSSIPRY